MSLPQEDAQRKSSTPGDFTTTPLLYQLLSPLSECWQLFRLLCSSHNPTFLPRLVFTRLPSKTRYGWVLLLCFLHFTIANCNPNSPANLINLYATTVNMKFHGIFLLSFFFSPAEMIKQNKAWGGRVELWSPAFACNSKEVKRWIFYAAPLKLHYNALIFGP